MLRTIILICILFPLLMWQCGDTNRKRFGALPPDMKVYIEKNEWGQWGISISKTGKVVYKCDQPANFEVFSNNTVNATLSAGYDRVSMEDGKLFSIASIKYNGSTFTAADTWSIHDNYLTLERRVTVRGNMDAGFLSSIQFNCTTPATRDSIDIFAPGMIYGGTAHLSEMAIGGSKCKDHVRIREDRLPAPLFGAFFNDGSSITILNSNPDSRTTPEDSHDLEAKVLIDKDFRFGAIGADFNQGNPVFAYWYPGTEGEVTYKGMTYPWGQMKKWSRRYHPVKDGLEQNYQISFRFCSDETFSDYYSAAWRWAWSTLNPGVNHQDIETAKRSLLNMLGERVETRSGITGITNFTPAIIERSHIVDQKSVMGFTGKALETANFLLLDALDNENPGHLAHRNLGESIVNSFTKLNLSPPEGEGFNFQTGKPALALPHEQRVYLRSFGDGLKSLLKAVKREKQAGINHDDWLSWSRSFADWLLPQQDIDGGFPRCWEPVTGEIVDPSPESSYTIIPYLVLLSEITGEKRYAESAQEAGEFCWNTTQRNGVFIGGTIDNPDVIDKEAGTLSLEAYLSLYHFTGDEKWSERAIRAGNFAETWIYLWDVPMPVDGDNASLGWKKGISTVGMQLISTGHSLADCYMSFDVNEYAELFGQTGDQHYYDVAMILLHNTKAMLALPGREYDLRGPGWQQEHWSLAPVRGKGLHRGWLPWVSTSHLNGIFELLEYDHELYLKMISAGKEGPFPGKISQHKVVVDGLPDEWKQVPSNIVDTPDKLWIGQGMVTDNWEGKSDLSFTWRTCHKGNKIYFLLDVHDNVLVEPAGQPNSWLNDCVEILIDPGNRKGLRFTGPDTAKELHGYELHFLPAAPNHVFLNDSIAPMYPMEKAQDRLFKEKWKGEIACTNSDYGYILELGFEIPGITLHTGQVMAMDLAVCDDDGMGRKSLMIWSGTKKDYWLSMDEYPEVVFD